MRILHGLLYLLLLVVFVETASAQEEKAGSKRLRPGEHEVRILRTEHDGRQLWAYLPMPLPKKLPCIFIAPSGSAMFHGMKITQEDIPEHTPYVKAGFAVVCYGVSGALKDPDDLTWEQADKAAKEFMERDAGISDGKAAIDWAMRKIPGIDRDRLISVGHSSAGTIALQLAQHDRRIDYCVAFMPVTETRGFQDDDFAERLEEGAPGFEEFNEKWSPMENTKKLRCRTFLFSSRDDDYYDDFKDFVEKLEESSNKVTVQTVRRGGHYEPMLEKGIPAALAWLKKYAR